MPRAELPATRNDVARHAGVSVAVVSYVMNDGPRTVAPATRARVLDAIAELGYRPNVVARALKTGQTGTLGLLVPDNRNPYFAELAHALEEAAFREGYALLVANSNNDAEREAAQLVALHGRQVDGIFVISAAADAGSARGSSVPTILLDRTPRDSPFSSVTVDNRGGAYTATRHLIDVHGHSRIACLAGPAGVPAADDRERGWRRAMIEAGLPIAGLLHRSEFARAAGYRAASEALSVPEPPTAVFASSDLHAVGLLRACHERRIEVPRDLAVFSFDGTQESEFTTPSLSVIRQVLPDIARIGVRMMLDPKPARPRHEVTPFEVVIRESCGCEAAS